LTKDYFLAALSNDFGISVFYMVIIISINVLSSFLWLPINIHFALGASEFLTRTDISFLKREFILKYARMIVGLRNDIKKSRHYIEFFMMFYFIFMTLLGYFSLVVLLIYVHYVKFKYKCNQEARQVIDGIKNWLRARWSRLGFFGNLMNKVLDGFFWIITF